MRLSKNPEPLQTVFPHVIVFCFSSCRFPKRWLHTLIKEFIWARKRKRKRKSKGKERTKERKGRGRGKRKGKGKGQNRQCLTRTIFDAKSYRFRYRFVIVRESCVCSFFSGNGCNHQKRSVATTYQAPSLCRICAITTTNNERKRPKALNSRRMMEKSRTLDFKSLDTDHYYNQRYRVFSLLSCFRVKAKNGSWGIMED